MIKIHEVQYICWNCFSPFAEIIPRCGVIRSDRSYWLPRAKLCCFSAKSVRFPSARMAPWHSDVFGIESIHLTLLYHSPPTICSSVIVDSWLPRAKLCCFSAKPDRCDSRSRRSDGSRCCSRASMNFNTFARCVFLRLPRSYRVAEKSDPMWKITNNVQFHI